VSVDVAALVALLCQPQKSSGSSTRAYKVKTFSQPIRIQLSMLVSTSDYISINYSCTKDSLLLIYANTHPLIMIASIPF